MSLPEVVRRNPSGLSALILLSLLGASEMAIGRALAADVDSVTIFGDSYSRLNRKSFPNWAEQLRNEGYAGSLVGKAVSGATAWSGTSNSYKAQVDKFLAGSPSFGDATVAYFGHNDFEIEDPGYSFSKSSSDFKKQSDRLIAAGAAGGDKRLFVGIPDDWSRNPSIASADKSGVRSRVTRWRGYMLDYAGSRENVVPVDIFTTFEKVFKSPKTYGFTNITTADHAHSSTTALYDDDDHFGQHGQAIIKQVFQDAMTSAFDASATLVASSRTSTRMTQDLKTGLAFNEASFTGDERLGLTAFPIGEAPLVQADDSAVDVSRAAFTQAYDEDRQDGGLGVNYELGGGMRFGVAITQYGDSVENEHDRALTQGSVNSDGVSVYFGNRLGGFELGSRFSYSNDTHEQRDYDDLVRSSERASFGGSTMEIAQRIGYPVTAGPATLTPWAELAHKTQSTDSYTMSSPYVSDTDYAISDVSETDAVVGLDMRLAPIAVGEVASLTLFGGLSYTHSLSRDDYEVTSRQEALAGFTQHDTVERPELRTVGLNLGAEMSLGSDLALGAALGVSHDPAEGMAETGQVHLTYRF